MNFGFNAVASFALYLASLCIKRLPICNVNHAKLPTRDSPFELSASYCYNPPNVLNVMLFVRLEVPQAVTGFNIRRQKCTFTK